MWSTPYFFTVDQDVDKAVLDGMSYASGGNILVIGAGPIISLAPEVVRFLDKGGAGC